MEIVSLILSIILVLCAVLLITVVLVQKSKSGGLGGAFGGDTQSFTPRGKAASKEAKLQKLTITTAIIIGVLAIALMIINQFVVA
ncbi:MAG: preprotein translocase subunit SecG [Clostridia bacterium]